MEALLNSFRSLGPARILALFIGISATVAISGMVINRLNAPGLALLYGGLNTQEAAAITQYLDSQNINYETRGEGSVYVPADNVGQLRLQVAGQGLVGGSNAGYELFDNASSFGTTNFVQNLNAKRALEGELARTIATIPAVTGARVHVVLPKQTLFSSQSIAPSAAVALNVGNRKLEEAQVESIAQLVAAAVPGLTNEGITVIDQRGTLLFDGRNQKPGLAQASGMRLEIEKGLESSLIMMLEKVVGLGKVAVHVTADVNTDTVQENSEIYDPTQQVVRSEQTTESTASSSGGGAGGVAGIAGNIPGGEGASAGGGNNSAENRTETTTNYEVGKTLRQMTRNGGDIRKLSVAVLLEGRVTENQNGEPTYTPFTDEQISRFRRLVEAAVGFDASRGDKIDIADMQFSAPPEAPAVEEPFMTKAQLLVFGEYALLLVAMLVMALMVVRPTINLMLGAMSTRLPPEPLPPLPSGGPLGGGGGGGFNPDIGGGESTIDIKQVQGRVRESSVKKVNEIIDQHPEESLNVVRGWMAETPGSKKGSDE